MNVHLVIRKEAAPRTDRGHCGRIFSREWKCQSSECNVPYLGNILRVCEDWALVVLVVVLEERRATGVRHGAPTHASNLGVAPLATRSRRSDTVRGLRRHRQVDVLELQAAHGWLMGKQLPAARADRWAIGRRGSRCSIMASPYVK